MFYFCGSTLESFHFILVCWLHSDLVYYKFYNKMYNIVLLQNTMWINCKSGASLYNSKTNFNFSDGLHIYWKEFKNRRNTLGENSICNISTTSTCILVITFEKREITNPFMFYVYIHLTMWKITYFYVSVWTSQVDVKCLVGCIKSTWPSYFSYYVYRL